MAPKRVVVFGWATSVHTRRWIEGLSSRGFQIRLISLGGKSSGDIDTVVYPRSGRLSYLRYCRQAVRAAAKFKPDLIHVHYAAGFGLWGLASRFEPILVSVWGTDIVDLPSNPVFRFSIKALLRKATWITATSRYLRDVAVQLRPEVAQRISVVPFGVRVPDRAAPFPGDKPVRICFLKAHRSVSGPDILIRAMKEVVRVIPDIRLSIAGIGPMTAELQGMVRNYGLEDNITFVGQLEIDQVYTFLQKHHMMVMPSRRESFGVAALEAAACGRPVIGANVGGVQEVIVDGETGLLVQPEDEAGLAGAIIKLALDADLRYKMGLAGLDLVEQNFRWEKSLDAMAALYERLICEKRKNTPV